MPIADQLLSPRVLCELLAAPRWWVDDQRFSLPCIVRARTAELVAVRVRELEHWKRAARAAFPTRAGVGS